MKSLKALYIECGDYFRKNIAKAMLVVVAMVLAYGFYCTSYTINVDDVFDSFWNGGRLIAAGRFTGYLIQAVTGFMTYSPFFTIFLALCIYFVSGLTMAVVINGSANGKLSSNALFIFWIMFVTYPIISEQIVYPIIVLLALGYLMITVAVYLINGFFESKSLSNILIAAVLIIISVDFYEAFASVFLTLMMVTVITRFCFSEEEKQLTFKKTAGRIITATLIMLAAIVIRFIIAKAVLFIYYGTTHAGYGGNNQVYWNQLGVFDCFIWLVRTVFFYYFWAGVNYLPVFVFAACTLLGIVVFTVLSVKRKNAVPILAYFLLLAATLSLNVIMGIAAYYTMAQTLVVFVSFMVTVLYTLAEKKHALRVVSAVIICLLVLNQAKTLNNWSVTNYERHSYEMSVIDNIGQELEENHDVKNKPVVFIGGETAPCVPGQVDERTKTGLPVVKKLQKAFVAVSDKVLPKKYFTSIGDFYGEEINNAGDLFEYTQRIKNRTSASVSYISWAYGGDSWFSEYEKHGVSEQLYQLFELRGYELKHCTQADYQKFSGDYGSLAAYPENGYITEKDNCIIVNFGE
jgi:hypothetical protein